MARRKTAAGDKSRWTLLFYRALAVVAACGLLWFAVEGGEYGTRALFKQHAKREQLEVEVAQLRQEVDSLEREKASILKNDAVLERIAREQYGMLRGNKELLFWMDNARAAKDSSGASIDAKADTLAER